MEAIVPTGGGPPPHIHHAEDETFYIVEGKCSGALLRGGRCNARSTRPSITPMNIDAIVARYQEAAPRHGLEFV
jgi:hypothetical protein